MPASMYMVSLSNNKIVLYNAIVLSFASIIGRAVFASCPNALAGCASNPTSLSVEGGDSIHFDATVVHTPGGSCGFRQQIEGVLLTKLNPEFGIPDELLLFCDTSIIMCSNSRVSLSRGNDPGKEFVFTLITASSSDSGIYEVEVVVTHPRTNFLYTITKIFRVTGIIIMIIKY